MTARLLCSLACVFALPWSAPALAWGDTTCEIAFQELNDAAREPVNALIRPEPEFDTFAEACTWPDHSRQREVEHYVNLPRDAEAVTEAPCPLATDCLISAIRKKRGGAFVIGATEQERLSRP